MRPTGLSGAVTGPHHGASPGSVDDAHLVDLLDDWCDDATLLRRPGHDNAATLQRIRLKAFRPHAHVPAFHLPRSFRLERFSALPARFRALAEPWSRSQPTAGPRHR